MFKRIYPQDFILKKLSVMKPISGTDFANLLLEKYRISPSLSTEILKNLVDKRLVDTSCPDSLSAVYEVSSAGKEYLQNKHDRALCFWVPYIITTIIAIFSLIVSFIR